MIFLFFSRIALSQVSEVVDEQSSANNSFNPPIEIEVPVYQQPVVQAKKIYTTIKSSKIFLETRPLTLGGYSSDYESDVRINNVTRLVYDESTSYFNLFPLSVRLGFDSESWGAYATVNVSEGDENSGLTIYSIFDGFRLGGGASLRARSDEVSMRVDGTQTSRLSSKETDLVLYFYSQFTFLNSDFIQIDENNKIGFNYIKKRDELNNELTGFAAGIRSEIEFLFKINPKLFLGPSFALDYRRYVLDLKAPQTTELRGVGNILEYEINLIKAKFFF